MQILQIQQYLATISKHFEINLAQGGTVILVRVFLRLRLFSENQNLSPHFRAFSNNYQLTNYLCSILKQCSLIEKHLVGCLVQCRIFYSDEIYKFQAEG